MQFFKIVRKWIAFYFRSSALVALGRRFETCRPDSNNPSHRKVSQPVFFIGWNMTYLYLYHNYVICPSLLSYSQIFLVLQYIFSRINIFKDRLIIFTVTLCEGFWCSFTPRFFANFLAFYLIFRKYAYIGSNLL